MQSFKKILFIICTFIFATLILTSCKKPPGKGGSATIKGKIMVEDWNNGFTVKNGEYPGADEDVYLIYGDNVSYDDKTKASYNGEFEFKYLRTGKYTVYVYSKDKTLQAVSGSTSVVNAVNITSKKQVITLDQITIYN